MITLKIDALQNEVLSTLRETVSKPTFRGNRGHRTKLLKKALCRLGHEKRYATYASGTMRAKTDFHEWLWDLVWAKQSKKKFRESGYQAVIKLRLITEMEWGVSEAERMDDFEKLRFGVADLRLFICGSEDKKDAKKALHLCRDRLCRLAGKSKARYLLVAINRSTNNLDGYRGWSW